MEKKRLKIAEAHGALRAAEGDFNVSRGELAEIMGALNLGSTAGIMPYGADFTASNLLNDPASNLQAALARIAQEIDAGLFATQAALEAASK